MSIIGRLIRSRQFGHPESTERDEIAGGNNRSIRLQTCLYRLDTFNNTHIEAFLRKPSKVKLELKETRISVNLKTKL